MSGLGALGLACSSLLVIPAGSYKARRLSAQRLGQLRVLHSGPTPVAANAKPEAAVTSAQLSALWKRHAVAHALPAVDFSRWVVFTLVRDLPAPLELGNLRLSKRGRIVCGWSRFLAAGRMMSFARYNIVTFVALPRAELPRQGFRFRDLVVLLTEGPKPGPAPRHAAYKEAPGGTLPATDPGRGTVAVPPKGYVGLGKLTGGVPVYVVHDDRGAVRVLATDSPLPLPDVTGLRAPLTYRPTSRRFCSLLAKHYERMDCFDGRGRSVLGYFRPTLDRYAYRFTDASRSKLVVGQRASASPAPNVIPRTLLRRSRKHINPSLIRPAGAKVVSLAQAQSRPEGSYVVFHAVLELSADHPPKLCDPKAHPKRCPATSPAAEGIGDRRPSRQAVKRLVGPYAAHLQGGKLTRLTWFGEGAL